MIITVASGKGGTGKTTVAVNMAMNTSRAALLDCDVEEPNVHLLVNANVLKTIQVHIRIPEINETLCNRCGKCSDFCRYNAIFIGQDKPVVFPDLCHSCGGCLLVCPNRAIEDRKFKVGAIKIYDTDSPAIIQGELDVGVPRAVPMIKAVKHYIDATRTTIIDAPPGVSCPLIEAVNGSDFCLLVTEPTPFGLHDLNLVVQSLKQRHVAMGIVINRATEDRIIHKYSEKQKIPILLEIPLERRIAELYAKGIPFSRESKTWQHQFRSLVERIEELTLK